MGSGIGPLRNLALMGAIVIVASILGGCGPSCTERTCSSLGAGGNNKTFQSCGSCDTSYGCDISLEDSTGNGFYHCSDSDGKTCSQDPNFLSSEASYCGI